MKSGNFAVVPSHAGIGVGRQRERQRDGQTGRHIDERTDSERKKKTDRKTETAN